MTRKKKFLILTIVILTVCIFFPYLKAEFLTFRFGENFKDGYLQTNMIDSIQYYKVLDKKNNAAKVIYITSNHTSANVVSFKKKDGTWKMTDWETVWSKSGSADGFMCPYYP